MKKEKILITGGCGFIGANLINKLKDNPSYSIRVLDNLSSGKEEDLARIHPFDKVYPHQVNSGTSRNIELVEGDIRDYETCRRSCNNCDTVIHLAANTGVDLSLKNPRKDMMVNIAGTLNMLEAARENSTDRFIHASSGAAVGEVEPPLHEQLLPRPISPYGVSKLSGEYYCAIYAHTFNLKTASLRFGNVYGPGSHRKSSVIAKFITRALNSETLEIYGDGSQTRDYIYVEDLVSAILNVVSPEDSHSFPWGEIFHIAASRETTVNEILEYLLPILSDSGYNQVKYTHLSPRKGDVKRNYSDTTKAQTHLNWKPEINLSQGLRRTVDWFIYNLLNANKL